MKLLAIDLGGTLVGWAIYDYAEGGEAVLESCGTWTIYDGDRTQSPGYKWLAFGSRLRACAVVPDLVAYEEVMNHAAPMSEKSRAAGKKQGFSVHSAHAYGGAEAVLTAWCAKNRYEIVSVPIGKIKIAATGRGGGAGTKKEDVLRAAQARWPEMYFDGYDSSDAAMIGLAALIELGYAEGAPRILPQKTPKTPRAKKVKLQLDILGQP